MDFRIVLSSLLPRLRARKVRYAIAGGVAVGILARPRATKDLDLLVCADDLQAAHDCVIEMGFERFQLTRSFSRYESELADLGLVDFQHAEGRVMEAMVRRARSHAYQGVAGRVRVITPEDLIGLKAVAIANNPNRRAGDYADMVSLVRAGRRRIDWTRVSSYFAQLNLMRWLAKLKKETSK